MGVSGSRKRGGMTRAQRKRQKNIEKQLAAEKQSMKQEVRIILVGTGDSGKSTFVKQMQILYRQGFTDQDRQLYRNMIRTKVKEWIKALIKASRRLGIELQEDNMDRADDVLSTIKKTNPDIPIQLKNDIIELWDDPGLKRAFKLRHNFQLPDTSEYFLDKMEEICESDFEPSIEDILRCRIPTTGINEIEFQISEKLWKLIDVGGQRSERRKWLHHFEDVTDLIFVTAINEYNMMLYEDDSVNRMQESLRVFKNTVNNEFFRDKDIILLLNKNDLFEEKIKENYELTICFDDYDGECEVEEAREFILNKFLEKVKKKQNREIYNFYTCATDTTMIESVFESIQKTILKRHLEGVF